MPAAVPPIDLLCLCAAWCRTCDAYRPVLEQAAERLRAEGVPLALDWIDIEDEAELVGDLDVETFPTVVIADPDTVRFAGPVTPEPDTLLRLLRAQVQAAAGGERAMPAEPAVQSLLARWRGRR